MKNIFWIGIGLLTIYSCKKFNSLRDDVSGKMYIQGRLFYKGDYAKGDTITPQPISEVTINIGYVGDHGQNFIYSTKSDSNGYFLFANLRSDTTYLVYAQNTQDSIMFYGQFYKKLKTALDTTLILAPSDSLQNGIVYKVSDGQNPVPNCQVCLFRSQVLSQTQNCALAAYNLTSNANGVAYKMNIAPGTYYSVFTLKIDSLTSLSGTDSFNSGTTFIIRRPVTVK